MPPATPASILSSPDRRSWPVSGWSVAVADRASSVVAFMLQGCRRRWPPSIGITPGPHPGVPPKASGPSLTAVGDTGVADVPPKASRNQPVSRLARKAHHTADYLLVRRDVC